MCSRAGCRPTRPRRSRRRRRRLRPSNSPSARSCDTYKPASNRATPGGHLVDSCLRRRPRAALRPRELRVPAVAMQTAWEEWTHTVHRLPPTPASPARRPRDRPTYLLLLFHLVCELVGWRERDERVVSLEGRRHTLTG